MKPAVLLRFYRVRLRSRVGAELLAVAGVAVGVALVFAALVANASLTGSVRELTEGIVGRADLQLAARGPDGFDRRVLRRVERVPGATAAPVAEARVNLVGGGRRRSVLLLGGDPRRDALGSSLLGAPKLEGQRGRPGLFLPAPLAGQLGVSAGERLRVETGAGVRRVRVSGVLDHGEVGELTESPVALAPLPLVQRLAGMPGRLSRVFVAAERGREPAVEARMRRIAGDRLNLGPADQEAVVFERASYPTTQSTSLFSVLSALVGFLFALNAVLLSVPQRRRLVAELRMAGFAPASVVLVTVLDAVMLGVAGAALGLLLGEVASRLLFGGVPAYLASAFAIGSQRIVPWQSVALAVTAGVLAACLAVLIPTLGSIVSPARRRRCPSLSASLRQDLVLAAAISLLAAALGITAIVPGSALLGLMLLVLSLLMFLEAWLRLVSAAARSIGARVRSPATILASLELQAGGPRLRTLALAGTGALAVFATVSIGGARADLQRGLDGIAVDTNRGAEVWVAFSGLTNIFGASPIAVTPRKLGEIERLDGVRGLSRNRGGFLDVGDDRAWIMGPDRARAGLLLARHVEAGDPALAARRLRDGGWVALSRGLAADLGVGIGDPVALPFPVPRRMRVAALTDNFGWPGGTIVIAAHDYARAWGSGAISSLGIRLGPGVPPSSIAAAVRPILGPHSALQVDTAAERRQRARDTSRAGLARLGQIAALVLISSVLAMAASMAGLVWQRRPLLAALKLHGLGEGELWRALLIETSLLLGAGCLLGAVFGLLGQLLLDQGLRTITGFPLVYEVAWALALATTLAVSSAAAAVLSLPGWAAVRVRPQAGLAE